LNTRPAEGQPGTGDAGHQPCGEEQQFARAVVERAGQAAAAQVAQHVQAEEVAEIGKNLVFGDQANHAAAAVQHHEEIARDADRGVPHEADDVQEIPDTTGHAGLERHDGGAEHEPC
jgi:hypothetical protein